MKRSTTFGLLLFVLTAQAQTKLPDDVARFVKERDICEHFRGEEPYDAKRGAYIAQQSVRYCKGTDRKLAALKLKYPKDTTVQAALQNYEAKIE